MYTVEAVTAGVDWLTATLPTTAKHWAVWLNDNLHMLDTIAAQGYELYTRDMQGYSGVSAGNCFVGSRDDTHIVQLSGHHSDEHFDTVYRSDAHVSRIDIQVTVKFDDMPSDIAKGAYNGAMSANLLLPAGRRRKIYIIQGSDGGDTCYIGAPSSDQRGRIYNKAVQSEDISYERTWRYEVTFRNEIATTIAAHISRSGERRREVCRNICCEWFQGRGAQIAGVIPSDARILSPIRSLPTDVERKLGWLRNQVSPTVRYLVELGFADVVREIFDMQLEGVKR